MLPSADLLAFPQAQGNEIWEKANRHNVERLEESFGRTQSWSLARFAVDIGSHPVHRPSAISLRPYLYCLHYSRSFVYPLICLGLSLCTKVRPPAPGTMRKPSMVSEEPLPRVRRFLRNPLPHGEMLKGSLTKLRALAHTHPWTQRPVSPPNGPRKK